MLLNIAMKNDNLSLKPSKTRSRIWLELYGPCACVYQALDLDRMMDFTNMHCYLCFQPLGINANVLLTYYLNYASVLLEGQVDDRPISLRLLSHEWDHHDASRN